VAVVVALFILTPTNDLKDVEDAVTRKGLAAICKGTPLAAAHAGKGVDCIDSRREAIIGIHHDFYRYPSNCA